MTVRPSARVLFWLVAVAAFVVEVYVLFVPVSRVRAEGKQTFVVKEFADGIPVGQTFRARTDGLSAADVAFSTDRPADLTVKFRLLGWSPNKIGDQWAPVIESSETFQLPTGITRHRFRFKPIIESEGQVFQFQVQRVGAHALDQKGADPPSIGVMASMDDSLAEGNAMIGHQQVVDRDLIFEADGADSVFANLRMRVGPQLPKALRNPSLQLGLAIVLLAIYNWAFAVFTRFIIDS